MRRRRISYFHLMIVLLVIIGISLIGYNLVRKIFAGDELDELTDETTVETEIEDETDGYEIPPTAMQIIPSELTKLFGIDDEPVDEEFTLPIVQDVTSQQIIDGEKILVLNYHKIDNTFNSLAIPPSLFEEQIIYLKHHGYQSISIDELYDGLIGVTVLPDKAVLITFDDGYSDNYYNAFPILKEYGMKATVFVVPGFTSTNPNYMTWEMLREMEKSGVKIESHTMTHQKLEELSDDEITAELTNSKKILEEQLGHLVEDLAYPTGTYNLHIANLAKQVGYRSAFTVKYGNADVGSNIYAIERVPIFQTAHTMRDFRERIEYRPIFEEFGWSKP